MRGIALHVGTKACGAEFHRLAGFHVFSGYHLRRHTSTAPVATFIDDVVGTSGYVEGGVVLHGEGGAFRTHPLALVIVVAIGPGPDDAQTCLHLFVERLEEVVYQPLVGHPLGLLGIGEPLFPLSGLFGEGEGVVGIGEESVRLHDGHRIASASAYLHVDAIAQTNKDDGVLVGHREAVGNQGSIERHCLGGIRIHYSNSGGIAIGRSRSIPCHKLLHSLVVFA